MSAQRKISRKNAKAPDENVVIHWLVINSDLWVKGIAALSVLPNAQGWIRKGVETVCKNVGLEREKDYIVIPPMGVKGGSKVIYIKGSSFLTLLEKYYINLTAPNIYDGFKAKYTEYLENFKKDNEANWLKYENGKLEEVINPNKLNLNQIDENGQSVKVKDMTTILSDLLTTVSKIDIRIDNIEKKINALYDQLS